MKFLIMQFYVIHYFCNLKYSEISKRRFKVILRLHSSFAAGLPLNFLTYYSVCMQHAP